MCPLGYITFLSLLTFQLQRGDFGSTSRGMGSRTVLWVSALLTGCGDVATPSRGPADAHHAPAVAPVSESMAPPSLPAAQAHHHHHAAPAVANDHPDHRHRARVAALAAVDPESMPLLGLAELRQARDGFAHLPAEAPLPVRVRATALLAERELVAGDTDRAVTLLEGARASLVGAPPEASALAERLTYHLGVALLRQAELRNCQANHGPRSCILPLAGEGIHQDPGPARAAMEHFQALLRQAPASSWNYYTSRWLLNIAAMAAGVWPKALRPEDVIQWQGEAFPRFPNVATAVGVDHFDHCGGAVADDFDGDGRFDLVSSSYHPRGQLKLWRNDGQGAFTDHTQAAGLTGLFGGLNVVHADYDNDGDLDLLVLRGGWQRTGGRQGPSLLRNDGGFFTDVASAAGLVDAFPTQAGAFADCDLDGDLDLYLAGEAEPASPGFQSRLYRNDHGHFRDIAVQAGVTNDRYAKGAAWGDYDGDRWPDLYVSNLHGANRLYHNRGDCTFEDVALQAGVAEPQSSFATWFWDFDNDGHLDVWVGAYTLPEAQTPDQLWYVAASHLGAQNPGPLPRLYKGNGQGTFVDVAPAMGLAQATLPMGAAFGDLDQDGWLDFYLGTGLPDLAALVPNKMYRSVEGKRFADVTTSGGFGHLQKGHGITFADLDNDGDQDIWEQMGGFFENDAFFNALYRNPGFQRHWIDVELRGTRSNRFGVGARIQVEAGGRSMFRHVGFGSSFGSRPMRENIGLGKATRIDRLTVWWPASDTRQVFKNVAADGFLRITEGAASLERLDRPAMALRGDP
jgi:hypothetical protein